MNKMVVPFGVANFTDGLEVSGTLKVLFSCQAILDDLDILKAPKDLFMLLGFWGKFVFIFTGRIFN